MSAFVNPPARRKSIFPLSSLPRRRMRLEIYGTHNVCSFPSSAVMIYTWSFSPSLSLVDDVKRGYATTPRRLKLLNVYHKQSANRSRLGNYSTGRHNPKWYYFVLMHNMDKHRMKSNVLLAGDRTNTISRCRRWDICIWFSRVPFSMHSKMIIVEDAGTVPRIQP